MHKGFPWATQWACKEDQTCGQRESEEEDNSNYIGEWLNVSKTPLVTDVKSLVTFFAPLKKSESKRNSSSDERPIMKSRTVGVPC